MTTSTTKLIAILATMTGLLVPGAASAKNSGSNNHSNFKITFGGNPPRGVTYLNNNNTIVTRRATTVVAMTAAPQIMVAVTRMTTSARRMSRSKARIPYCPATRSTLFR